jgi:hypothetical protein
MADGGWIKLYRRLTDDTVWALSTPEQKTILITLLLMASHQANEWEWQGQKFEVQPGQMVTSIESIRAKSGKGISVKNVRTSLKRFENLGFLANESAKTGRLITIANWGKYQCSDEETAKQLADGRQRGGKEVAPNKKVKNVKNKTPSFHSVESRFENLWELYPKKHGKQNALKKYRSVIKTGTTDEEIRSGIEAYKQYLKRDGVDPQFIKDGSTFFNGQAWKDDWGPEQHSSTTKKLDKAETILKEVQEEMANYPDASRQEAAEMTAMKFTQNGRETTAAKILAFLDKMKKEGISNE